MYSTGTLDTRFCQYVTINVRKLGLYASAAKLACCTSKATIPSWLDLTVASQFHLGDRHTPDTIYLKDIAALAVVKIHGHPVCARRRRRSVSLPPARRTREINSPRRFRPLVRNATPAGVARPPFVQLFASPTGRPIYCSTWYTARRAPDICSPPLENARPFVEGSTFLQLQSLDARHIPRHT